MQEFYKNNYQKRWFNLFVYNNNLAKKYGRKEFTQLPLWRQHFTFFGVFFLLISLVLYYLSKFFL